MSHPTGRHQQLARTSCHEPRPVHRALLLTLALAIGLMVMLIWSAGRPISPEVQAMPAASSPPEERTLDGDIIHVATTGVDNETCRTEEDPCRTVQHAVDIADPGDEIRVAAGTYTGTNSYGGLSQLVYLTKTLTIRGSYDESDWTLPDPEANPSTILDAEGTGRVMVISPTITVHLEGLRFQGGDATGLGGGLIVPLTGEPTIKDAGGGLYVLTATVTISNSVIFSNTGSVTGTVPGGDVGGGLGGGIYVRGGSIELRHNEIVSNTAGVNVASYGGGIYVDRGSATLLHNAIMSNTACIWDAGEGGGLYLYGRVSSDPFPNATLLDNWLQGNYASRKSDGWGGGMYANHYDLELLHNQVQHNVGGGPGSDSRGGGLYIFFSDAWLRGNQVLYNTASAGKEGISGGVHFCTCNSTTVVLESNTILGNVANTFGNGYGGGVSFCNTTATLDSNLIISNTATLSTTAEGWGGGVWAGELVVLTLSNDIIAGNHAQTWGGGLFIGVEDVNNDQASRLQHVTIANNTGGNYGHGLYVTHAEAYLTNTIITSHTYGVWVASGGRATLDSTLWYGNERNTAGNVIQTNSYEGDPAFADPAGWDYHIGIDSVALDRGVATQVRTDMDAQPRPWQEPDLGADEYWPSGILIRAYLPLILRP